MSVCLTNGDTHKKAWGAINHWVATALQPRQYMWGMDQLSFLHGDSNSTWLKKKSHVVNCMGHCLSMGCLHPSDVCFGHFVQVRVKSDGFLISLAQRQGTIRKSTSGIFESNRNGCESNNNFTKLCMRSNPKTKIWLIALNGVQGSMEFVDIRLVIIWSHSADTLPIKQAMFWLCKPSKATCCN